MDRLIKITDVSDSPLASISWLIDPLPDDDIMFSEEDDVTPLIHPCSEVFNTFEIREVSDIDSTGSYSVTRSKSKKRTKPGNVVTELRSLPKDFTPAPFSVICGRGKKCTHAPGSLKLKEIVADMADLYFKVSRECKSKMLDEIMVIVQDLCPSPEAAFIRRKDDRWWSESGYFVREKISSNFREHLHLEYRSSNKSKVQMRKHIRAAQRSDKMGNAPKATDLCVSEDKLFDINPGTPLKNVFWNLC